MFESIISLSIRLIVLRLKVCSLRGEFVLQGKGFQYEERVCRMMRLPPVKQ